MKIYTVFLGELSPTAAVFIIYCYNVNTFSIKTIGNPMSIAGPRSAAVSVSQLPLSLLDRVLAIVVAAAVVF